MANENETVREVCAEMNSRSKLGLALTGAELNGYVERILSAYEREMAAKDAEIEAALKKQNDYHAALLTICTANKTAEGLREVAIDACNGKENQND